LDLNLIFSNFRLSQEEKPLLHIYMRVFPILNLIHKQKMQKNILVNLQSLGTEGQGSNASNIEKYNLSSWALPFGFGYKTNYGENLSLGIEWIWRSARTDYLDDVSGYYVDENYLTSESAEMANPGVVDTMVGKTRGNPNNKDWYHFTGITLSYKIKNKAVKCPKELLP
jgi:hypothetical protein